MISLFRKGCQVISWLQKCIKEIDKTHKINFITYDVDESNDFMLTA